MNDSQKMFLGNKDTNMLPKPIMFRKQKQIRQSWNFIIVRHGYLQRQYNEAIKSIQQYATNSFLFYCQYKHYYCFSITLRLFWSRKTIC